MKPEQQVFFLRHSILGKISKNTIIESIEVNDINYTQPSEIAELFNEHFTNVGHDLAHQIPPIQDQPDILIRETRHCLYFQNSESILFILYINSILFILFYTVYFVYTVHIFILSLFILSYY
jgi:hypothetical protein